MPNPTAEEQFLLELLNETRLNPLANALRYISSYTPLTSNNAAIQNAFSYFKVDGTALLTAFQNLQTVGPLAWNSNLADAAQSHSAAMITADQQSHQVPGEAALGDRVTAAGYKWARLAENVFAYSEDMIHAHAGFMVDWGNGPNGMQDPAGHRINIMSPTYNEVGIDVTAESNAATQVGPYVVTQDFGNRGLLFVTGVAYNDKDGDNFYSVGEGIAGLKVAFDKLSTTSGDAGGYSLQVTQGGSKLITLSGGGLSGNVYVTTTVGFNNIKFDIVNGNTLLTSGTVLVEGPLSTIKGLGIIGVDITAGSGNQAIHGTIGTDKLDGGSGNDTLYGYEGNDRLFGGSGNDEMYGGFGDDIFDGQEGNDVAVFSGSLGRYSFAELTDGSLQIKGPDGTDTAKNVEFFRFTDGQFMWSSTQQSMVVSAGAPPVVSATQAVTTNEDTAKLITVAATDSDGDKLTYVALNASHGKISGGVDGAFTYTPDANYAGADSFVVTVSDGKSSVTQTVNITVVGVNDAPTVTATQSLSTSQDVAKTFNVVGNDIDGDKLNYVAGSAGHGSVTGGANGAFTYTPIKGFSGNDTFNVTVSDGKGGSAVQTISVLVAAVQPPPDSGDPASPFRMFMPNGFVGKAGGTGSIFGTNALQDISLVSQTGIITFDGSFNRGGDIIRIAGNASDYKIALAGSTVEISKTGVLYSIPLGTVGTSIVFGDGVRKLVYDQNANSAKIGSQLFNEALVQITAPTDSTSLPTGAVPTAQGRTFLSEGGSITIGGDHNLFGTAGAEKVYYRGGDLLLDPSFNRGGDTLYMPLAKSAYSAYISGSSVILMSADGDVTIPVGTAGITINFAGENAVLRYDATTQAVKIGDFVISGSLGDPDPLGGGAAGDVRSIDVGDPSNATVIALDTAKNFTLTDDAHVNTNVVIHGFNAGDLIKVTNAQGSDYNFAKVDADGDRVADDLAISFIQGGTINLISMIDVITTNAFVFDVNSARAAVGSDFISFG